MTLITQYGQFTLDIKNLIQNHATTKQLGEVVFKSRYCKRICRVVALKFRVNHEDVHSELTLNVIESSVMQDILNGKIQFAGRIFIFNVMRLARQLQKNQSNQMEYSLEEIPEIAIENNIEFDTMNKLSNIKLENNLIKLKSNKLQQLEAYRIEIHEQINLNTFIDVVELNLHQIMSKQAIKSRYTLIHTPLTFKTKLTNLLDEYIRLFKKWFLTMEIYVNNLVTQYKSWLQLYKKLKPNCSYVTFYNKYAAPSIWDMNEFERLVRVANA